MGDAVARITNNISCNIITTIGKQPLLSCTLKWFASHFKYILESTTPARSRLESRGWLAQVFCPIFTGDQNEKSSVNK